MYKANDTRYEKMKYSRCGKSGLFLPLVSIGGWHNFGTYDSYGNMKSMCETAFDFGITHFDFANNYGPIPGSAEENFGKILRDSLLPYRDELLISTKAGYDMWEGPYGNFGSRKYLFASIDQSLKRMGLDYVDIFYHHRPDKDTPLEETMEALSDIVRSGKALYVGISNYSSSEMLKAARILADNHTPLLINQVRYSILDRHIEEDGLFNALEEVGAGIICFSPLAQGLLTNRYLNGIPSNSRASKNHFLKEQNITPSLVTKLKALNDIALSRGQSLAEMSLSWVLKNGNVTSVLIGASSSEQILTNINCINNTEFSIDELKKIDSIIRDNE